MYANGAMAGTLAVMGLDGAAIDRVLGQAEEAAAEAAAPKPEPDTKHGITKMEWAMMITGGLVLTATVAGLLIRRGRVSQNRRARGRRKNRMRRWGEK